MTHPILIIDDDERLLAVLARRFNATQEYRAQAYTSVSDALQSVQAPCFAIFLDMMIDQELGLDYISALKARFSPQHLIIMTGYASIATTVTAMKRGATDYIAKPASFNELLAKISHNSDALSPAVSPKPLTAAQAEWEHLQRVLTSHNGNISKTAEALGMHRRSLQRKLQKYSPTRS